MRLTLHPESRHFGTHIETEFHATASLWPIAALASQKRSFLLQSGSMLGVAHTPGLHLRLGVDPSPAPVPAGYRIGAQVASFLRRSLQNSRPRFKLYSMVRRAMNLIIPTHGP